MAFGSCFSCIKYSVLVFNFLLWLLGCALLAVGSWLLTDDDAGRQVMQLTTMKTTTMTSSDRVPPPAIVSYSQVTDSDVPATLSYLFITFGCVIIVVAFIGCCGAVRESPCLLVAFFASLFVVFTVLLGVCIWAFVVRSELDAHTSCLPVYFNYVGIQLEDFMRDRLLIVAAVSIAIAASLVLAMISVSLLCCAIRERRWNTNA